MAFHFLQLPPELRSKVFSFCEKKDLISMSLVNKQCCTEVRPYTWACLRISWQRLKVPNDCKQHKHCFQFSRGIHFGNSQDFSFHRDKQILRQGFASFSFCNILDGLNPERMEYLSFSHFLVADGLQLASLQLSWITTLRLSDIEALGNSWEYICNFHLLEELQIFDCDINSNHLRNLSDLGYLEVLKITQCRKLDGSCLAYIGQVSSRLKVFKFRFMFDNIQGDSYATHLRDLTEVKKLSLACTQVKNEFLLQLSGKLKNIVYLNLGICCKITDVGLQSVSTFCSLNRLDLDDCYQITDVGFRHISKIISLRQLYIRSCEGLTNMGLDHISKLKNLELLDISSTLITDEGIVHVARLASMKRLFMDNCVNITDASLELISGNMLELEGINCLSRNITAEGLIHLLELPHLTHVYHDSQDSDFRTKLANKCVENGS